MTHKQKTIEFAIPRPDKFHFGALVTDKNRNIIYVNSYFSDELNWPVEVLTGKKADDLFSPSSKTFYDNYMMPLLLIEKKCDEMQLALLDGNGKRISIIVSAKMDEQEHIYWSFFNASKRDKLYDELLDARKILETQATTLKLMASTDELTGLMNRRELNLRAPELINQANRYGHTISFLMIDIDFFKHVNDSFGHLEGDSVLRQLGQSLQKFGRKTDLIARFGGEEFIMILPDTGKANASQFAQRLHDLVSNIKVDNTPITVSIGVTISNGKQNLDTLTLQADGALYYAKNNGRNRTEFYLESAMP